MLATCGVLKLGFSSSYKGRLGYMAWLKGSKGEEVAFAHCLVNAESRVNNVRAGNFSCCGGLSAGVVKGEERTV